jgi:outer membrane protein assembly factor BamB
MRQSIGADGRSLAAPKQQDAGLLRASCVALVLVWTGRAISADWPQWLGPSRNGVTEEVVAVWSEAPKVRWRQPVSTGFSSPVVAENKVFVHAAVPDADEEEVLAFNAQTGDVLWRDRYPRARYGDALGAGPRATPIFASGRLYTYGITGVLSCYEAASGKRLWQEKPYEKFKSPLPNFGVCSSPVLAGGNVVVLVGGTGSAVVAFDAVDGTLKWQAFDEPVGSASPVVITQGEGENRRTEVVVQTTLRMIGVDPAGGAMRWEHPIVFQPSGVSPTPLSQGDVLICTTQDTGTMAISLVEGGAAPQLKWWKQDLASYFSSGTLGSDNLAYLVTNLVMPLPRADVRCVDIATGEQLWHQQGLGYFHVGVIRTGDGKLLLLDDAGNLVLAEAGRNGYRELAKSQVCRGTLINPALADGRVFVRDDRELICVELHPAAASESGPQSQ